MIYELLPRICELGTFQSGFKSLFHDAGGTYELTSSTGNGAGQLIKGIQSASPRTSCNPGDCWSQGVGLKTSRGCGVSIDILGSISGGDSGNGRKAPANSGIPPRGATEGMVNGNSASTNDRPSRLLGKRVIDSVQWTRP